jgi:uncharacterized protein (TIGR02145 family)
MKFFKYIFLPLLVFIILGVFTNPGLGIHQKVVKGALKNLSRIVNIDSLAKSRVINDRLDSLIKTDDYYIFSKTHLIVDDKLKEIGFGCLGKVWLNDKFDSVGKKLIAKLINKPNYYSIAEICLDESIDSTVTIGNQVWMKKDFDKIVYNNGDTIPEVKDVKEWVNLKSGAWCYLDNDSSNLKLKGRLYNWYALNDPRGIAPEGFRIPEKEDWRLLASNLGEPNIKSTHIDSRNKFEKSINTISDIFSLDRFENTAGYKLKKPIGWTKRGNGSNESGFGAVQAGERYLKGIFTYEDIHWWCKSDLPSGQATMFFVGLNRRKIFTTELDKSFGFSIRFIKK